MKITPINYTNQKANYQQNFGAKVFGLKKIATDLLPRALKSGETERFLKEMDKRDKAIRAIKFNGTDDVKIEFETIYASSSAIDGTCFNMKSKLYDDSIGNNTTIDIINTFRHPFSGKKLAKVVIKAIKSATKDLANDKEYLENKAIEVQKNINSAESEKIANSLPDTQYT